MVIRVEAPDVSRSQLREKGFVSVDTREGWYGKWWEGRQDAQVGREMGMGGLRRRDDERAGVCLYDTYKI